MNDNRMALNDLPALFHIPNGTRWRPGLDRWAISHPRYRPSTNGDTSRSVTTTTTFVTGLVTTHFQISTQGAPHTRVCHR